MRISEILPGGHYSTLRRVGIRFTDPDDPRRARRAAIQAAVHLLRSQGIDCDCEDEATGTVIWVEEPRHRAAYTMGLLERATGTPGFSEWDPYNPEDYGTVTT